MNINLTDIISRCKVNDRVAQKELYHYFADYVMKIALRYSSDTHEAKDIVQNSFVQCFTKLSMYDHNKGAFKSWLCRVTINEALGIKRKRKNWILDESPELNSTDTVGNEALSNLSIEEIKSTLTLVSEDHRIILQMYYFDELSHKEVAEILNIEVSSSRGKLSRARKSFINLWNKMQVNEVSR